MNMYDLIIGIVALLRPYVLNLWIVYHRLNSPFKMLILAVLVITNIIGKGICEELLKVINFEECKFNERNKSYGELLPEMQRVRSFHVTLI